MAKRTIEIIIDGLNMSMDAKGFKGKDCLVTTETIRKMMGAKVVSEDKKQDMWEMRVPAEVELQ
jgi:hypothetical protein